MDGLECSEVLLSNIINSVEDFRLDSHFYEKEYIVLNRELMQKPHWLLKDIVLKPIQTGHTPSMKDDSLYGGNIAFIKTDNLHSNFIKPQFNNYLSEIGNEEIKRTELQTNDIITTIIGATFDVIARSALIFEEHLPANINQNIVQIRIDAEKAFPEYVNAYLNTFYGKNYLIYLSRQTEQVNLNCQEVGRVVIPRVTKGFQDEIKKVTLMAHNLHLESVKRQQDAVDILNNLLKIVFYNDTSIGIKNFKDSFYKTGRLDAEYYQPKYEDYERMVRNYPDGYTYVKNEFGLVVEKCDRNFQSYPYVEIGDISVSDGSSFPNIVETEMLPANAKIMTKANDILVSTVRPNRGAVAILEEDNLLVSGAFVVLRQTGNYQKEVLQVLLRSEIYRDWMLRFNVGSSYPVIKEDDVLNLPIPLFDKDTQNEISEKVQASARLRKESKRLLDVAIKAVEMAIETDEETALSWIKTQV